MSSSISYQLTPLYAPNLSSTGNGGPAPLCSLLKIESFYILLDCGWNELCDEKYTKALEE
jgi:hypothetical protein